MQNRLKNGAQSEVGSFFSPFERLKKMQTQPKEDDLLTGFNSRGSLFQCLRCITTISTAHHLFHNLSKTFGTVIYCCFASSRKGRLMSLGADTRSEEIMGSHWRLLWALLIKRLTRFAVCFWVHDDKLRPEFADAPPFEDGHQPSQIFQVECVAGSPRLRTIFRPLHGAVEPLVPSCGIADKVPDVVGVRDWGLGQREERAVKLLHPPEKTCQHFFCLHFFFPPSATKLME